MVLLIMTSLNVGYNLATGLFGLAKSDSTENLEEEFYTAIEDSGTDLSTIPAEILDSLGAFISNVSENSSSYELFSIIFYLLVGASVYLMYKRQKKGLNLYIVVQLIGAFSFLFFFGSNMISIIITLTLLIWALIWIMLYYLNRKALN